MAVVACSLAAAAVGCGAFGAAESDPAGADAANDAPSVDAPDLSRDAEVDAPSKGEAGKPDASTACNGALACDRIIFVTSKAYVGKLGGLAGADAKCQAAAAAGTPEVRVRQFRAWLSTSITTPEVRLRHGTNPYKLPNKTPVASSWDELTGGTLKAVIDRDESSANVGSVMVWTGTTSNGTATGTLCTDWSDTSGIVEGTTGNTVSTGTLWTAATATSCTANAHLYCIEY